MARDTLLDALGAEFLQRAHEIEDPARHRGEGELAKAPLAVEEPEERVVRHADELRAGTARVDPRGVGLLIERGSQRQDACAAGVDVVKRCFATLGGDAACTS